MHTFEPTEMRFAVLLPLLIACTWPGSARAESASAMPIAETAESMGFASPAVAQPAPFVESLAVSDDQLGRVRGGFEIANGLQVSFGIQRAIYINGELVTTTSLTVSGLGKASAGQIRLPSADTTGMTLIQNGAGNTFLANPSASSIGTVIQNSLDNQKIQNVTAVNAVVNSAQVFKGLSLQSTLNSALTSALRR